ncbi:hypothetical protein [Tateyamaria sp.]
MHDDLSSGARHVHPGASLIAESDYRMRTPFELMGLGLTDG